jgi:hypothetical protein
VLAVAEAARELVAKRGPSDLPDEEVLARLVALNGERAADQT